VACVAGSERHAAHRASESLKNNSIWLTNQGSQDTIVVLYKNGIMTNKFQLELLRTLRKRKGLAKGFTLIELLIVVAILGLLAAIGIPRYLDVRANAEAGALAGEAVGLGKECGVYLASGGLGTEPTYAAGKGSCNTTSGGSFVRNIQAATTKVKCIADESVRTDKTLTVSVQTTGDISCTFS
jgi:prepilin-type N-terminal cleavage/methylation domain-containing protein